MYHRPMPTVRAASPALSSAPSSRTNSPRHSPLIPSAHFNYPLKGFDTPPAVVLNGSLSPEGSSGPTICGLPLKYVSLITLAVQNAALAIVMHYSRISTPPALAYSPASAVLLNEILKGSISFVIALMNKHEASKMTRQNSGVWDTVRSLPISFWDLWGEIFSPDCWKLSIPAILYVVQNSLQFVAVSNLPVATFQVTYQMKILTTAAFSVALLRRTLSPMKWLSLLFLAFGVGIVQIQSSTSSSPIKDGPVGSAHDFHMHIMNPFKGFCAVTVACLTSGLAGVYFEMVLKGSKADLWVRNVQLSLFSLIPALMPIIYATPSNYSQGGILADLFRNFGLWAWATVGIQVFGGLVTAVVIKYSDNILKGFATSLSIIFSFLASVVLFEFTITPSFIIGASVVLVATWMYNQPPAQESALPGSLPGSGKSTPYPGTPIVSDAQLAAHFLRKKSPGFGSPHVLSSALGLNGSSGGGVTAAAEAGLLSVNEDDFDDMLDTPRYLGAPYGSPYGTRPPSVAPSRVPSRGPSRVPSRVPSRAPSPKIPLSPLGSDSGYS
ncbi:hypothetical protein BDN72DRAFT_762908 [Pluteus cervinus]|uniref:Uncharacterized protein n=1 Tax=Pluteus cervinus TaxID=181527 RepID=A0ACD3B4L3_9AGAR|nr:hypothetical protein BDN72DRAFT_762908 [Pluteus cervinus]